MKSPKAGTTMQLHWHWVIPLVNAPYHFFYMGIGHLTYMGSCICEFSAIALLLDILSLFESLTGRLVL